MLLTFASDLPTGFRKSPIVISGPASLSLPGREYVLLRKEEEDMDAYEIRYDVHSGPFREAALLDGILGVGYEDHFYLFNTLTNEPKLILQCEGYFGHLYLADDRFYVAYAFGLYCMDITGHIVWQNDQLGIDGVILERWDGPQILGTGEWDPPGGWRNFVVDKQTGLLIM